MGAIFLIPPGGNHPGEYNLPGWNREVAIYGLFNHYGKNPLFMSEFGQFIDHSLNDLIEIASLPEDYWGVPEEFPSGALRVNANSIGYQQSKPWQGPEPLVSRARDFAIRWGLAALWGPEMIARDAAANALHKATFPDWEYVFPLRLGGVTWSTLSPTVVELKMIYHPVRETRKDFLDRAKCEVMRQADEIERAFREAGMERQWRKSESETHIEWLYERIALKLTPTQIWDKHQNDPHPVGQDAIEKGIREVARLLDVTLPRNRSSYVR